MSEQFEKDLKRLELLRNDLETDGYSHLTVIEGRGICGLLEFVYTVGLCFGLDYMGYSGRYCYPKSVVADAVLALNIWDGNNDPLGRWVKYKGRDGEYTNPKEVEKDV
jgi:hypothetical protein